MTCFFYNLYKFVFSNRSCNECNSDGLPKLEGLSRVGRPGSKFEYCFDARCVSQSRSGSRWGLLAELGSADGSINVLVLLVCGTKGSSHWPCSSVRTTHWRN